MLEKINFENFLQNLNINNNKIWKMFCKKFRKIYYEITGHRFRIVVQNPKIRNDIYKNLITKSNDQLLTIIRISYLFLEPSFMLS